MAVFMFTLFINIPLSKGKWIDRKMYVGIVYISLSVWEQQHAWPSAPPAPNFLPHASVTPSPTASISLPVLAGHWPLLADGTRLHSGELFHYKLLPWSWLKRHWHADWLLWSLLMRRLIFPPFQWEWILNSCGTIDGSYRRWRRPMHTHTPHSSHCARRVV